MAELIRDRYEPLRVVGAGGQSTVVQALDHERNQLVALKVREVRPDDEESQLLREARLLEGLEPHPLLCPVHDDFFAGERYYLVTDWVEGTTLADHLAATGGTGLPLDDVIHYLSQVAEAIDHLHRHQPPVVHGDVKPANIIVTPEGKAVLVDFGISRREDEKPLAPTGTAGYAAPETRLSPASDVFSLAATAFALLTGRPPRPGVRPAWTGIDPDQARQLELALRRGLSLDPARRPGTASALIDALQGQQRTPNNLPAPATPFVGRTTELARVKSLLSTSRLVTLTGAPGMGKTRLAIEVATDQLADYPDGAFLIHVDADLTSPGDLERRNVLLVLDGCEAALEATRELAGALLDSCPHIRVLATSRHPLGVGGEQTYGVPPLSTPDPFRLPPLDRLGEFDAVRLFIDRAAEVAPDFDVRAGDAPALAQICRRLDGIPLALELVAARAATVPLPELVRDVAEQFPLLPGDHEATVARATRWASG